MRELLALCAVLAVVLASGCVAGEAGDGMEGNSIAVFQTSMGTFRVELFEDRMPVTAGNFKKLAEEGFYGNLTFHRIISGFMIQGGDPTGTGTGGPGYTIEDEFVEGEGLSNVKGTLAMANTGQPDSGGSQFFINLADNTYLDFDKPPQSSRHPVFGRVISGMDVVEAIGRVETDQSGSPAEDVTFSVSIEGS